MFQVNGLKISLQTKQKEQDICFVDMSEYFLGRMDVTRDKDYKLNQPVSYSA